MDRLCPRSLEGESVHRRVFLWFLAALVSVLVLAGLTGCGGGSSGSGSVAEGQERGGTLTVLAASSLTDAFGELGKTFEEQNGGVTVRQSFESSSTLLTQIQQGAPADRS